MKHLRIHILSGLKDNIITLLSDSGVQVTARVLGNTAKERGKNMYKIIEKSTGYLIDIASVNTETRKLLEECGFICRKVD